MRAGYAYALSTLHLLICQEYGLLRWNKPQRVKACRGFVEALTALIFYTCSPSTNSQCAVGVAESGANRLYASYKNKGSHFCCFCTRFSTILQVLCISTNLMQCLTILSRPSSSSISTANVVTVSDCRMLATHTRISPVRQHIEYWCFRSFLEKDSWSAI